MAALRNWRKGTGQFVPNNEELDEILVFGYACKIFRDDEKASDIERGKHLIPWNGNTSILIDRSVSRLDLYATNAWKGFDFVRFLKLLTNLPFSYFILAHNWWQKTCFVKLQSEVAAYQSLNVSRHHVIFPRILNDGRNFCEWCQDIVELSILVLYLRWCKGSRWHICDEPMSSFVLQIYQKGVFLCIYVECAFVYFRSWWVFVRWIYIYSWT